MNSTMTPKELAKRIKRGENWMPIKQQTECTTNAGCSPRGMTGHQKVVWAYRNHKKTVTLNENQIHDLAIDTAVLGVASQDDGLEW